MLIVDIDDASAGWIYIALVDLKKRMVYNGKKPPSGVDELADFCLRRARQGQAGSALAELDGLADAQAMTRKTLMIDEGAGWANVSRSTMKRLIASGEIPTVNIGGCVRIRVADLESWLAERPVIDRSQGAA